MTAEESYKRPVFVGPVADQLTAEQTFRAFAIGRGVADGIGRTDTGGWTLPGDTAVYRVTLYGVAGGWVFGVYVDPEG